MTLIKRTDITFPGVGVSLRWRGADRTGV